MKFSKVPTAMAILIIVLASAALAAIPQLISFQGVLTTPGGTPVANGSYSVSFKIYDAPAGGTMLWTETQTVTTTSGVFSALLGSNNPIPDSAFNDSSRYLGVTVSPDAEMAPRQKLAAVAYANRVASLLGASGGLNVEYGDSADTVFSLIEEGTRGVDMACPVPPAPLGPCPIWVTATVGNPSAPLGQRSGLLRVLDCNGVISFRVNGWSGDVLSRGKATFGPGQVNAGLYGFVAGAYNQVLAGGTQATIPGGYCNVASAPYATVGGGTNNTAKAIHATVGGGQGNLSNLQAATTSGGDFNSALSNFSTVGGGHANSAFGDYSTVSGGEQNRTQNFHATVGGGKNNAATGAGSTVGGGVSGTAFDTATTVGGGRANMAFGVYSTVGGGQFDSANGAWSAIGGGQHNVANGTWSTIPGGLDNVATGAGSLAAGTSAWALHDCSFVWADCCINSAGFVSPFLSQGPNTFNARASGGFYLATSCDLPGSPITSGVFVPPGGAAWAALSDSTAKHNIRPVNGAEILAKLALLPIKRWSYKTQADGIDHIGPMAQDFYNQFGLGDDNKHISTLDPDGISLAAAKELYARSLAQSSEIAALKSKLQAQATDMSDLKSQMASLKAALDRVMAMQPETETAKLASATSGR